MLLDSFIQLLSGYNIFGSKVASNNRLSSLFDDELIMGSYITRLLPIIMSITFILNYKKKNIIPNFCFGCFKIQIEPNNVLDLVKLYFVFDNLELPNNNWRKCMLEFRNNINGLYKGFVYCSSLKEAENISNDILNYFE